MKRLSPEEELMFTQTLKLLGSLSREVSYILCPETHRLKDMCEFYDSFLPDEPKNITITVDGKEETMKIQKGDIVNSWIVKQVIVSSFWRETNKTILNPDSLIPAIASEAVSEALKIKQATIDKMNAEQVEDFVKGKFGMSLEEAEELLKKATKKKRKKKK
jgi:hypothetical protein